MAIKNIDYLQANMMNIIEGFIGKQGKGFPNPKIGANWYPLDIHKPAQHYFAHFSEDISA